MRGGARHRRSAANRPANAAGGAPALGAKPLVEGWRRFWIGSPRSHRMRPRGLSLGFARRRRLGGIGYRWFLWRKHNGLGPLQFTCRRLDPLAWCLGGLIWISAGGIRRVSGAYPSSSSPSPVKFTGSNHWKMLTFRSSIAAHPARPKPADKGKETSATRAQPPNWYSPSVARVLSGHRVRMDARVTPHGCCGINSHTTIGSLAESA